MMKEYILEFESERLFRKYLRKHWKKLPIARERIETPSSILLKLFEGKKYRYYLDERTLRHVYIHYSSETLKKGLKVNSLVKGISDYMLQYKKVFGKIVKVEDRIGIGSEEFYIVDEGSDIVLTFCPRFVTISLRNIKKECFIDGKIYKLLPYCFYELSRVKEVQLSTICE